MKKEKEKNNEKIEFKLQKKLKKINNLIIKYDKNYKFII